MDLPAFQRAERGRVKKTLSQESVDEACAVTSANASNDWSKRHKEDLAAYVPESIGANVEHEATRDGKYDDSHSEDESETFSDIDDEDVDVYLHDEEGKRIKKILWEKANREYVKEQAAKEAAAAANKKAFEANFGNCSEDLLAARELAASAAEAVAKSRKERKQRRANEAENLGPAQSAAVAVGQMFNKKRSLQSKVNFDRLGELFNELEDADDPKKQKKESKVEDKNDDEMGSADEFEYEGDMGEMYQNTLSTENMAEKYFPEDDGSGYNDYGY